MSSRQLPPLTRQTSIQQIEENQSSIGVCWSCWLLPAATAVVIIASQYDPSASMCNMENSHDGYIIDLPTFLFVAGGIQIGYTILYFVALFHHNSKCIAIMNGMSCCLIIFYLIWSIIGLIIYSQEMNYNCQSEPISKAILSWSIIQSVLLIIFIFCCSCFMLFATLFGESSVNDRNERDPLIDALV